MASRVAVVFSGQLRGFPSLWHDIRARLISANDADVYAAFWRETHVVHPVGYTPALQCFKEIMQPVEVLEIEVLNSSELILLAG